jgi:energy-coupling factor transporter ATP-binding protein EcfA2
MRPRHLVLDEPTAQLDPEGSHLVASALRELAATGTALLVAEHKTDILDGLCTRIVALADGRIVADGAPTQVFEDPRLTNWGVDPPARIRLARLVRERGLDPAVVLP